MIRNNNFNRNLILLILIFFIGLSGHAQKERPKLIVGIVVDQMRPDYLNRYYNDFDQEGFKTLLSNGFSMWNVHYNYVPTYTGPGHASVYSGTTPRFHGIIGNDIFSRDSLKTFYCVDDQDKQYYIIVNDIIDKSKGFSPRKLIVTNICDELKMATNNHSRVISISLKDRAAILSAGHLADCALWLDLKSGNFVTSNYYTDKIPGWVEKFNGSNHAAGCIAKQWNHLPGKDFSDCSLPDKAFTVKVVNSKKDTVYTLTPGFPHDLIPKNAKSDKFGLLYNSPMADSLLTDLAIEAINNDTLLAKGTAPDVLAISYSATDAVGHLFGPDSKEVKDSYLRLDKDLARLIATLDKKIGKDNYTLFLTADHGVAEFPENSVNKEKFTGGYVNHDSLLVFAKNFLKAKYSSDHLISTLVNDQFYLNRDTIEQNHLNLKTIQTELANELVQKYPTIAFAYPASVLNESEFTSNFGMRIQNGFNPKISGDVALIMKSGFEEVKKNKSGNMINYITEHGSGYTYDTNIPLIWYGKNIKKGESWQYHSITDLAATLSMILRIKYPSACIGNPITEIITGE